MLAGGWNITCSKIDILNRDRLDVFYAPAKFEAPASVTVVKSRILQVGIAGQNHATLKLGQLPDSESPGLGTNQTNQMQPNRQSSPARIERHVDNKSQNPAETLDSAQKKKNLSQYFKSMSWYAA